jgi:hypothetical protein
MGEEKMTTIDHKRATALSAIGLHQEVLNEKLQAQVAKLDDHDIAALTKIHDKLNAGLADKLRQAADTVGGFVW